MSLPEWLANRPDRCPAGYAAEQHPHLCVCPGLAAKARGQAATTAAHPDERALVEAAIRAAAATGRPFSANSIRSAHGVRGPVVGATFTALRQAGVIRPRGDVTSTGASANGHRIFEWEAA